MEIKIHNPNRLPTIDYRGLEPLQGNLKDLTEKNYNKLKTVLNRRGFTVPVFIWKHDGVNYLMDGHGRQRVMLREQMNDEGNYAVPYILIEAKDRRDAKAQLLEISSQYQTITQEGFDEFTDELENEDFENVAFDALQFVAQGDDDTLEEDEAPPVADVAVSKLGEIYKLGRHRVMCGDSTVKENVDLLMDGNKADMVFTDPPYGVDYSGRGQNTSNKIENDALSIEDTEIMVSSALKNAFDVSRDGTTCFVWHADSKPELRPLFERAFIGAGFKLSATIIWLKKQASMGFQDYRSRHEPCLYGWKGTRKERVTDRTQTTVWESGRDSNYEHPTQKPVFLAATAIANHNPGVLLDLFLGSGSTLIACEQTDRTCYGMELDPKYCDVIRKRYWKFINGKDDGWQENTPVVQSGNEPAATNTKPAASQPDTTVPVSRPVVPTANTATVGSPEPGRINQPEPQQETGNPQTAA
jgi:DNA modification methylase